MPLTVLSRDMLPEYWVQDIGLGTWTRPAYLQATTQFYFIDPTVTTPYAQELHATIEGMSTVLTGSIGTRGDLTFANLANFADTNWEAAGFNDISGNEVNFQGYCQHWFAQNIPTVSPVSTQGSLVTVQDGTYSIAFFYFAEQGVEAVGWPFGNDGPLLITNGNTVNLAAGSVMDYSSIQIDVGGTLDIQTGTDITVLGSLGDVTINGNITCDGINFYGGSYSLNTPNFDGTLTGELVGYSINQQNGGGGGSGGSTPKGANGGGGGSQGYGSGGGGGGGSGTNGINQQSNGGGGGTGGPLTGGGGGAGGLVDNAQGGNGGTGGTSGLHGQALYIKTRGSILGTGAILMNGSNGNNGGGGAAGSSSGADAGGGGGGGGGSGGNGGNIWLRYQGTNAGTVSLQVYAGGGGGGGGGGPANGPGNDFAGGNGAGGASGVGGSTDSSTY